MNRNGNHDVAVADRVNADPRPNGNGSHFADAQNPILQPATPVDSGKKKSWQRRLISWFLALLLIGGSAVALYLLLRVNRVNVRVDADPRRDSVSARPKAESGNTENGFTAEAIDIARAASGVDTASVNRSNSVSSPNGSPTPTPSPGTTGLRNLAYNGTFSPVNEKFDNNGSNGDGSQQQNNQQQAKLSESANLQPQNHANTTNSIYVDDSIAPPTAGSRTSTAPLNQARAESKLALTATAKSPPAVLPPFGTMLPVRTQGVIFTLRNNSYARLELTRDVSGPGWSLPKGTVMVGHTVGSEYDRAFVNVIGYIDPRDNKLVKMAGEVMGSDGGAGITGKQITVNRKSFNDALRKVASSGVQLAGMMAGALGRGPVIIDGAGYRLASPITEEARNAISGNAARSFVKVSAGQSAYVMVSDLPKATQATDAPGDEEIGRAANSLNDREVMELILFGSPDEVRAALPLMNDEQKRLAMKTLRPEDKEK